MVCHILLKKIIIMFILGKVMTCESLFNYIYNLINILGFCPVVSLSSETKLSGSGTYNDVYIVI